MMPTLTPCVCGGKAKMRRGLPNMGNSRTVWAFVQCQSCGMRTPKMIPQKGESLKDLILRAAERWNRVVKENGD